MSTAAVSASASKTTKKSVAAKAAEPVVAAPAPVAAPVAAAPAKATKATKAAAAAVAAPAIATAAPVVAAPVVAAAPASPTDATATAADEDLATLVAKALTRQHEISVQIKALNSESAANTKTLEKLTARLAKKADRKRKNKKAVVEGAAPKPCIFTTPVAVSDELLAFLGKPKNTEISRSNVTKAISAYCKEHKLMNKQAINADAPLRKLLTLKEDDKLTILNLQKFLGRHYTKATPVAA